MMNLKDDILVNILKQFNLSDRAILRLVCKRFKNLVDTIPITKLVIFEILPPIAHKLKHTYEVNPLADTACVNDLQLFFSNDTILEQMKNIEFLVIYGIKLEQIQLKSNTEFKKIRHLELDSVLFKNSQILKSTHIETLILISSDFHDPPKPDAMFKFTDLISKRIKRLEIDTLSCPKSLKHCIKTCVFHCLEQLTLSTIVDIDELLPQLSQACESLKRINLLVPVIQLPGIVYKIDMILKKTISYLREDLKVYINGIKLNKDNISFVSKMIKLNGQLYEANHRARCSQLTLYLTMDSLLFLKKEHKERDLTEFFKIMKIICIRDLNAIDVDLIKLLTNCEMLFLDLDSQTLTADHLNKCLNALPSVERIGQHLRSYVNYGNDVLDSIIDFPNIYGVQMINFNRINLDFILKIKRLYLLELILYYPIDQLIFIEILKQCPHLHSVDIMYKLPDDCTKDQLSSMKNTISRTICEEFDFKIHTFKLQIVSLQKDKLVRLVFRRGENMIILDKIDYVIKLKVDSLSHIFANMKIES